MTTRDLLSAIALPLLTILAAFTVLAVARPDWAAGAEVSAWALTIAAGTLAWRYRLGNMLLVAGLVAWEIAATNYRVPLTAELILPICIGLITTARDRGVQPRPLAAQAAAFVGPWLVLALLEILVPAFSAPLHTNAQLVGILFQAAHIIPIFILLWRAIDRRGPLEAAAIGVLVASYLAATNPTFLGRYIFLAAAALLLAIGLVQNSYRVAFLDELTGIPGRRALMSFASGLGSTYVVAMSDVDHFKKFNDTYGHDVGDDVLKKVAAILATVTGGGRAFRYGGEEFTIVFADKTPDQVADHLDAVREAVNKDTFQVRRGDRREGEGEVKEEVRIAVSIGAAGRLQGETFQQVMKRADLALYAAKQAGRNRVVIG